MRMEHSGHGPRRTLYQLTEDGEAELRHLLETALTSFGMEELGAGVAFMQMLPRQRAIGLLSEQRRAATSVSTGLRDLMPGFSDRAAPPHLQDLLALWSGGVAATAGWTEQLIRRLEAGEYVMADDRPHLP